MQISDSTRAYIAQQILWDSPEQKLYVGMHNKELAITWLEYFSCTQLLPIPLKLQTATAIHKPRIRQEILASCTFAIATEMIAHLNYNGLDLNKTSPQLNRSIEDDQRGDEVKVLYNDTLGDRRIGKIGIVNAVHSKIYRLDVQFENGSTLNTNPNWVVKVGHRPLPPVFYWLSEKTIIWDKEVMYANGAKTAVEICKANSKNYHREHGFPVNEPYVYFKDKVAIKSFEDLSQAKAQAELSFSQK